MRAFVQPDTFCQRSRRRSYLNSAPKPCSIAQSGHRSFTPFPRVFSSFLSSLFGRVLATGPTSSSIAEASFSAARKSPKTSVSIILHVNSLVSSQATYKMIANTHVPNRNARSRKNAKPHWYDWSFKHFAFLAMSAELMLLFPIWKNASCVTFTGGTSSSFGP